MPKPKEKIADRFEIVKEIGRGSFSRVYLALDLQRKKRRVALKYETIKKFGHAKLRSEVSVYDDLKEGPGIARIFWTGTHGKDNVMAMQLLGPSLNDLFDTEHTFSMKTVALLADQIIKKIEYIHAQGYIHRDIKPGNFAVGRGDDQDEVYIIDFGLTKHYKNSKTDEHIPMVTGKKFVGTPRYGSINSHAGREQSRRDDLESIGYMLMYFYFGCLPWHGIEESDKVRRNEKILQLKKQWKYKILEDAPWPLKKYMQYVYNLDFEEKPDYRYLRGLFRAYAREKGFEYDNRFDWCE